MGRCHFKSWLEKALEIARHPRVAPGVRPGAMRWINEQTSFAGRRAKILKIFRSRIDNADLNFTLDTPGRFSLKNPERVLRDNHAFN